MCMLRDCSVCECPDNEFPESFKKQPYPSIPSTPLICQRGNPQDTVDRTMDTKTFRGWIAVDNPWTNDDETDNGILFYFILTSSNNLDRASGNHIRLIFHSIKHNCSYMLELVLVTDFILIAKRRLTTGTYR